MTCRNCSGELRDIPVNHVHSGDIITLVDLKDGKTYTGMVTFNG
jgi:hypothetical protein